MSPEPDLGDMQAEARFQHAYARFLTDEPFRMRILDPATGNGGIADIGPDDIGRLRAMDRQRVELFAQCLIGNRMASIAEALPLTVKVLGDSVYDLVRQLDAQEIAVDTRKYAEASRFADYVLSDPYPAPLPDATRALLHFEITDLRLRLRPQWPAWPDGVVRSADALRSALARSEDVRLVINGNHALLGLAHDVEKLRELAAADAASAAVDEGIIVLLNRADSGVVHHTRLDPPSAAAILMIAEGRTFRALVSDCAQWLDRAADSDLQGGLADLCVALCAREALGFLPAGADDAGRGRNGE